MDEKLGVRLLTKGRTIFALVALLVLGAGISAHAKTMMFSFSSLTDGASNTAVQNYMKSRLGAGQSVTVSGSSASNSYTGDNHVVGPRTGTSGHYKYSSVTLATTDGTFIKNTNSNEIDMAFSGLHIYSVSFDYEIFPDGSCPDGRPNGHGGYKNCSSWPDFTFFAGTSSAKNSQIFNTQAVMPGNPGAPYLYSPAMHSGETAPQYLGTSGTIDLSGVTYLRFVDWPATIGIDNLQITTTPTPETGVMALLGMTLVGVGGALRRARGKRA